MRLVLLFFAFLILVLTLSGCVSQPCDSPWILRQGGDMPSSGSVP